ncbi:MAG TPA: O-antigen ligase family protein [Prolixibacteraceae bacterium]|nr:O-antigen ligase family protein [Prolixibacteraceae bacterium]
MNRLKAHSHTFSLLTDALAVVVVGALLAVAPLHMAASALAVLVFLALSSWIIVHLKFQVYFMMAMAFLLPFSVELPLTENIRLFIPGEPLIVMALFTMGWKILYRPSLLRTLFSGESRWVIPLIISLLLSLAFSSMKIVSVKFTLINLSYLLVFFLWMKVLVKEQPDLFPRLVLLFSLAQLLVVAWSVYQFAGYDFNRVTIKGIFRPFYKDHTILGATSALLGMYWLLIIGRGKHFMQKCMSAFLGMVILGSVLLSFSRAAFLSLVFAVMVWVALQLHMRIKHLVLMAVAALLLAGLYHQPIREALSSNKNLSHDASASYLERLESSGNISTDLSNLERLNRWYSGIKMAQQKPLAGFGPGTYQFQYIPYQSPHLMNRLTVKSYWHIPENSGGTAHSEYILALSEMGIPGFISLLTLIGRWIWIAFEKRGPGIRQLVILTAFVVLSTYLFHGAFNNFLNTDKFAFLFWGFAAWLAANYELTSNVNSENTTHEALTIQPGSL